MGSTVRRIVTCGCMRVLEKFSAKARVGSSRGEMMKARDFMLVRRGEMGTKSL